MRRPPRLKHVWPLAAGVMSIGLALAEPAATASRPKPATPMIAFASDRSGDWRIWLARPDGSAMRQLTKAKPSAQDVDPAFSPDGRRIVFSSTRGGATGVWVTPVEEPKPVRICDGDQAEWSPDGKSIVFRRKGRIVTRDLAGGGEKVITAAGLGACSGPSWSPDGGTIAFAVRRGGANAIYVVPAAGGEAKKVHDKQGACEPHWSPDGKRIVFETEMHICTMNRDGTNVRLVTYYGGVQRYGRFSPDGRSIVFCQGPSPRGPWELYVVAAAGGTPRRLTSGGSDMHPDWTGPRRPARAPAKRQERPR